MQNEADRVPVPGQPRAVIKAPRDLGLGYGYGPGPWTHFMILDGSLGYTKLGVFFCKFKIIRLVYLPIWVNTLTNKQTRIPEKGLLKTQKEYSMMV